MISMELQDDLKKEIDRILEGQSFFNSDNIKVPMQVFKQTLPISSFDSDLDFAPFMIVEINKESIPVHNGPKVVEVTLYVCLHDSEEANQGHMDVAHVMNMIELRFETNPVLKRFRYMDDSFVFELQKDDFYPYFIGTAEMKFLAPAIQREDPFV